MQHRTSPWHRQRNRQQVPTLGCASAGRWIASRLSNDRLQRHLGSYPRSRRPGVPHRSGTSVQLSGGRVDAHNNADGVSADAQRLREGLQPDAPLLGPGELNWPRREASSPNSCSTPKHLRGDLGLMGPPEDRADRELLPGRLRSRPLARRSLPNRWGTTGALPPPRSVEPGSRLTCRWG